MKLHSDSNPNANRISAYGPGFFVVNDVRHTDSIILSPDRIQPCRAVRSLADVGPQVLAALGELGPEILLIGTGAKHRLPSGELLARLTELGAGAEVMRSDAACRTYNILVAENRNVVALLMLIRSGRSTEPR